MTDTPATSEMADDNDYHQRARDELERGVVDPFLFAKAHVRTGWNAEASRREYVKLRAKEMGRTVSLKRVALSALLAMPIAGITVAIVAGVISYSFGLPYMDVLTSFWTLLFASFPFIVVTVELYESHYFKR